MSDLDRPDDSPNRHQKDILLIRCIRLRFLSTFQTPLLTFAPRFTLPP